MRGYVKTWHHQLIREDMFLDGRNRTKWLHVTLDCQKLVIKMYAHDLLPFAFSERLNARQC